MLMCLFLQAINMVRFSLLSSVSPFVCGSKNLSLVHKALVTLVWVYLTHGFPGGSDSEESACNVGDLGSMPWVGKDPLEKKMAIHSSILAWRIPRTLQSMGSQRVRHDWTPRCLHRSTPTPTPPIKMSLRLVWFLYPELGTPFSSSLHSGILHSSPAPEGLLFWFL